MTFSKAPEEAPEEVITYKKNYRILCFSVVDTRFFLFIIFPPEISSDKVV